MSARGWARGYSRECYIGDRKLKVSVTWSSSEKAGGMYTVMPAGVADEMLRLLHLWSDNYDRESDCTCNRCEAQKDTVALLARLSDRGTP